MVTTYKVPIRTGGSRNTDRDLLLERAKKASYLCLKEIFSPRCYVFVVKKSITVVCEGSLTGRKVRWPSRNYFETFIVDAVLRLKGNSPYLYI